MWQINLCSQTSCTPRMKCLFRLGGAEQALLLTGLLNQAGSCAFLLFQKHKSVGEPQHQFIKCKANNPVL